MTTAGSVPYNLFVKKRGIRIAEIEEAVRDDYGVKK